MIHKRAWEWSDKAYLRSSLLPCFGQYELRKITPQLIEQFIRSRLESGVQKSSINRELSCLSMVFKKAIDWDYLRENPMSRIKRFAEKDNVRERALTKEEEEKLLENSSELLRSIILTALNTGMRSNEILNLRWDQIDFNEMRILVENTKSGKNRKIGIDPKLHDVLRLRDNQSPYVFPNPDTGKPLTTVKKSYKTACKKAGIENLRFHDLRHTFGTRIIQNGVDIETVRELMGHESYITTQRYLHTNEQRKKEAVDSLAKKGTEKIQICYTGTKSGKLKRDERPLNVLFPDN
jgi:integrase